MRAIGIAYGRALAAQLRARMLLLSLAPFLMSLALWTVLLWFWLQPLVDAIQRLFTGHGLFAASGSLLAWLGLGVLKAVVVPMTAMLLLLPLMILTALIFMAVFAMPAIVRHVGQRSFPQLERREGGSWWAGLAGALGASLVFLVVFVATLPLYALPPLAVAAHVGLWGWLTARVVAYDALASHASAQERRVILRAHRWPLLAIGMLSGAAGALPGLVWVGGAVLSVLLFPLLAAVSIWLYVVVFVFTGLWFTSYCLQALADLRQAHALAENPAGRAAQ